MRASAGSLGFRGSEIPLLGTDGSRDCNKAALIHGLKTVDVLEAAIRALQHVPEVTVS